MIQRCSGRVPKWVPEIVDSSYVFPLWQCEKFYFALPQHTHLQHSGDSTRRASTRNLLFDLGAGVYTSGSLKFMVDEYGRRGIRFDRILAWEATEHTARSTYEPMPASSFDIMSYHNVPVNTTVGDKYNPIRTLRAIARPEDFVVLKLDIDPDNRIEEALMAQLLEGEALGLMATLVDEFYYEHHTHLTPMSEMGWRSSLKLTSALIQDSYTLFHRLREMGVRAHSWI